ncbi:thymidylate kinase [Fopius arisanus]|uniref:Thymidylate kinase n=1 Tax=Fopius arisanus TaxID=64838 RepID=A0A9R1TN87_9HYME|nr:PREDICTED: thymidylate kinase [Fopius arisanus]
MSRGALLVLEGCDRAGKSTQVKKLVQALNDLGITTEERKFPDRSTTIGKVIDEFLTNKKDLPPETMHLLFSANRWECVGYLRKALENGTTLVVDRYAASGAAYAAVSTKRSLSWCMHPDRGLPAPDFVGFLAIDDEVLTTRGGWANERFEKQEFQRKVADNFLKLKDDTWRIIQGNQEVEDVHKVLLDEALKIIKNVKDQPIKELYQFMD